MENYHKLNLLFLNDDILELILNNVKDMGNKLYLLLISKKINILMKDKIKKYYYFKIYKKNYETHHILKSIKHKLYLANMIGDEFYKNINTDNLYLFNKSIHWGDNSIANESWVDLFSFNFIIWNKEEIELLYNNYGIDLTF